MSDPRAGFTLVESLAALTVLAAGLVLIQQIYSNSMRAEATAEQMNAALWLADQQMALAVAVRPSPGIETGGSSNGLTWRRRTRLVDPLDGRAHGLWKIEVDVTIPSSSRVTRLSTLQLGPVSDAAE